MTATIKLPIPKTEVNLFPVLCLLCVGSFWHC
jgi:hypothetical protein